MKLKHITQDPTYRDPDAAPGSDPLDALVSETTVHARRFFPGPATDRLAVVDLDPGSGQELPPVPLREGAYVVPDERKIFSSEFIRCSAFAIALKTLNVLEHGDILGRRLRWPWGDAPVRLIVRAGRGENAWYDRDAREIRFFSFGPERVGRRSHTALLHDVVAHEVGHLVVDSLLPWLHDAVSPQSLAVHEALADLVALSTALRAERLEDTLARSSRAGGISGSSALANLEWSTTRPRPHRPRYLRSLRNDRSMSDVDPIDPHDLSQVLSGSLFRVIEEVEARLPPHTIGSGRKRQKRVRIIGKAFRLFVFRALDYVPPGEIGFVDLVRAMLAFDEACHRDVDSTAHETLHSNLLAELHEREVTRPGEQVEWRVGPDGPQYTELVDDIAAVGHAGLDDPHTVRELVERHRGVLGLKDGQFSVLPRLHTQKRVMLTTGSNDEVLFDPDVSVSETILRIDWPVEEDSGLPPPWPAKRRIRLGTMLAIGWSGGAPYIRAHLPPRQHPLREVEARSSFARSLERWGWLRAGTGTVAVAGEPGEPLRLSGVQRAMHIRAIRP